MGEKLKATFAIVLRGKILRTKAALSKVEMSPLEIQVAFSDCVNAFMCCNFGHNWRHDYLASEFYKSVNGEIEAAVNVIGEYIAAKLAK